MPTFYEIFNFCVIEDKVYDKIIGNEQLQIFKQQKAEIIGRIGEINNEDLKLEGETQQDEVIVKKKNKSKDSKKSYSKVGSRSESRGGSKPGSALNSTIQK